MKKKRHGRTANGKPITDELVEQLAGEAEAGYDVDETLRPPRRTPADRLSRRQRRARPAGP